MKKQWLCIVLHRIPRTSTCFTLFCIGHTEKPLVDPEKWPSGLILCIPFGCEPRVPDVWIFQDEDYRGLATFFPLFLLHTSTNEEQKEWHIKVLWISPFKFILCRVVGSFLNQLFLCDKISFFQELHPRQ